MKSCLVILGCLALAACRSANPPHQTGKAQASADQRIEVDANTQRALGVEVRPAGLRSLTQPILSTGQLQLNEDRTWHVGAVVEGRIVKILPQLGSFIRSGDVVAELHSHDVHDSRANRRQAIVELERLKVLAEQARRVRDRTQRLLDLKAASREQMEEADTHYRSALLNVSTAQAQVERTESHLTEFLDVALETPGEAASEGSEADTVPIKSPSSGTVLERLASVGSVVSTGDPVIVVSDLSSLWLIAAVDEANLPDIRTGQQVGITVRAYSDSVFTGKVFRLGESLDPQTRTLQVRVLVSNPDGKLKPGMFANASFASQSGRQGIYVPESAVQALNARTVVFVRTQEGAFEPRDVVAGPRIGREIEIVSGIDPETPIVVNGALLLKGQLSKAGHE